MQKRSVKVILWLNSKCFKTKQVENIEICNIPGTSIFAVFVTTFQMLHAGPQNNFPFIK